MPLILLSALAASLIPVGAVAIAKLGSSSKPPGYTKDGELIVTLHPGQKPDSLVLLAMLAGGFYLARKAKIA